MKNVFVKRLIIFLLIIVGHSALAQNKKVKRTEYGNYGKAGSYTEYVSKNGAVVTVGDTLQIGNPSNFERYVFLTQNDAYLRADQMNKLLVVKAITVSGDEKKGYKIFFTCKGLGATPVFVNYEDALQTHEIKLADALPTVETTTE